MSVVCVRVTWDEAAVSCHGDMKYSYNNEILNQDDNTYEIRWFGQMKANGADKVGPGTVFFARNTQRDPLVMLGVVTEIRAVQTIERPFEYRVMVTKFVLEPLNVHCPVGTVGRLMVDANLQYLRVTEADAGERCGGISVAHNVPDNIRQQLIEAIQL